MVVRAAETVSETAVEQGPQPRHRRSVFKWQKGWLATSGAGLVVLVLVVFIANVPKRWQDEAANPAGLTNVESALSDSPDDTSEGCSNLLSWVKRAEERGGRWQALWGNATGTADDRWDEVATIADELLSEQKQDVPPLGERNGQKDALQAQKDLVVAYGAATRLISAARTGETLDPADLSAVQTSIEDATERLKDIQKVCG